MQRLTQGGAALDVRATGPLITRQQLQKLLRPITLPGQRRTHHQVHLRQRDPLIFSLYPATGSAGRPQPPGTGQCDDANLPRCGSRTRPFTRRSFRSRIRCHYATGSLPQRASGRQESDCATWRPKASMVNRSRFVAVPGRGGNAGHGRDPARVGRAGFSGVRSAAAAGLGDGFTGHAARVGMPLTLWVTRPSYRRLWWPADGSRQRWSAGTPRGQRRAVGRWPDTTGRPREGALNLKDDY